MTAPTNPDAAVSRLKAALAAGSPVRPATYLGVWGVRDIAVSRDGHSVKVLLGRQRNWTWLAYGQLEQLLSQLPRQAPYASLTKV